MQNKLKSTRASSVMEYMTLIVFLLSALFVFQHYIVRGFSGGWKNAGDTFGMGRQFDPRSYGTKGNLGGTLECFYDYTHCQPGQNPLLPDPLNPCPNNRINAWVDTRCYEANCDCTLPKEAPPSAYNRSCLQCIENCISEECS